VNSHNPNFEEFSCEMLNKQRREGNEALESTHLDIFIDNIKKNKNFTFTKYGDGELSCMLDVKGGNCDGHPYSPELGRLLKESLLKNSQRGNTYIGDWTGWMGDTLSRYRDTLVNYEEVNYICYEILLNHKNEPKPRLYRLHRAIKNSARKKIFVGPRKLSRAKDFFNCYSHIIVLPTNSFSEYHRIRAECINSVEENCIFMFACGMPSKVIISDILDYEEKVTCLDFGSGFDNILLDNETRQGQVPPEKMKIFYKKLLT